MGDARRKRRIHGVLPAVPYSQEPQLFLEPSDFVIAGDIIKPVFAVGAAELIQSANLTVSALVLNNIAAGYGDDSVADLRVGECA